MDEEQYVLGIATAEEVDSIFFGKKMPLQGIFGGEK